MKSVRETQIGINKNEYESISREERLRIQKQIMDEVLDLVERFDGNVTLKIKLIAKGNC